MFGTESLRLLREDWDDTNDLAKELYAMFLDTIPLEHNAPVTITVDKGSDPPLSLRNFSNTSSSDPFAGGFAKFVGDNGSVVGGIDRHGDVTDAAGNKKTGSSSSGRATSSSIYAGVVVSGGPGDTYTVSLLADDGVTSLGNVSVKQQSIDSSETIKPGTKTLVGTRGTRYFMQVPVWGEPA